MSVLLLDFSAGLIAFGSRQLLERWSQRLYVLALLSLLVDFTTAALTPGWGWVAVGTGSFRLAPYLRIVLVALNSKEVRVELIWLAQLFDMARSIV